MSRQLHLTTDGRYIDERQYGIGGFYGSTDVEFTKFAKTPTLAVLESTPEQAMLDKLAAAFEEKLQLKGEHKTEDKETNEDAMDIDGAQASGPAPSAVQQQLSGAPRKPKTRKRAGSSSAAPKPKPKRQKVDTVPGARPPEQQKSNEIETGGYSVPPATAITPRKRPSRASSASRSPAPKRQRVTTHAAAANKQLSPVPVADGNIRRSRRVPVQTKALLDYVVSDQPELAEGETSETSDRDQIDQSNESIPASVSSRSPVGSLPSTVPQGASTTSTKDSSPASPSPTFTASASSRASTMPTSSPGAARAPPPRATFATRLSQLQAKFKSQEYERLLCTMDHR